MEKIVFQIKPTPPFRLDLTVWALRRRPHNLVDCWDGRTYRRLLSIYGQPVEVSVTQTAPAASPLLKVEADHCPPHLECAALLTGRLLKMLGLNADLRQFYQLAAADDRLHPLVVRWDGFKPPQFPTVFEALINAIACQQLTLNLGIQLLNRLAAAYGPAKTGADDPRGFPRPADLADLDPEALRPLGFSGNKAVAIVEVARLFKQGAAGLEDPENLKESEIMARLRALRGIGRWSAEYVMLRGLGCWSVFPGDDVGARRALASWLQLPEPPDYQGVRRHLAPWHPYSGLLYFYLLLNRLADEGHLS
jgi:DNA-3-methyladenine glycosylase II